MANSTRYFQLTSNILLEYVYVDMDSDTKGDSSERIIDLKHSNELYRIEDTYNGQMYLFCRDGENDNKSGHGYDNLVVGTNQNDSKLVKMVNETGTRKYNELYSSELKTTPVKFKDDDSCDVYYDRCIIHFTNTNYFGDYDAIIFQAFVKNLSGYKISLASILFGRDDVSGVTLNKTPFLVNQNLYTTHISFRIPSTNFMLTAKGKKFLDNIDDFENSHVGKLRLQKNCPIEFNILGVKSSYSVGGFTFMNTENINSIQVPFFDSYKKVNIEIDEADDGDYFKIYARVNKGAGNYMSFSDYINTLDANPTEFIVMHEITLFENFVDIYNDFRSLKTHSEYHLVNLSAYGEDNELDDVINYRPICIYAARDVSFTIEDTLKIINTEDNTTVVRKSSKTFKNPSKYGKKTGRIFTDEAPLQVNVFNRRTDEDIDSVKISKSASNTANGNRTVLENHQHIISSLVECTNVGVTVQRISQADVE